MPINTATLTPSNSPTPVSASSSSPKPQTVPIAFSKPLLLTRPISSGSPPGTLSQPIPSSTPIGPPTTKPLTHSMTPASFRHNPLNPRHRPDSQTTTFHKFSSPHPIYI